MGASIFTPSVLREDYPTYIITLAEFPTQLSDSETADRKSRQRLEHLVKDGVDDQTLDLTSISLEHVRRNGGAEGVTRISSAQLERVE